MAVVVCPPWHTVFFSLEGMRALTGRYGFELIEVRPAPQGRVEGWMQGVQAAMELVNRLGWSLLRGRWPGLTAHTFVLRKTGDVASS